MKIVTATYVFLALFACPSFGAFCTYDRSSGKVTCGNVMCDTTLPASTGDQLPVGNYYIGDSSRNNWLNLYPQRQAGGYWDYHTKVPEFGCRGGFGLHYGTRSEGCITVTDNGCFANLHDEITNNFSKMLFAVFECRLCYFDRCWWGTNILIRPCRTDLEAI